MSDATRQNFKFLALRSFVIVLCSISCLTINAQVPGATSIRVNDIEIHYIEKGIGEPLILLHGGLFDLRSWQPQIDEFSRSYRVISYSRRYSFPNKNNLSPKYRPAVSDAEDLRALLKKLGLKRVHLVGLSYGALTGLIFAVDHSAMVASMTLAEPPAHQLIRQLDGGEQMYQAFLKDLEPMREAFRAGDERQAMVAFNRSMGRDLDKLPPAASAAMLQNARALSAINLSAYPAFPDIKKEKLRKLKVPTLIVKGEHADKLHAAVSDEIARLIPRARSIVVPNAGHATPRDNPPFFNSAVLDFLSSVKTSNR